jgi:hypothetical protein
MSPADAKDPVGDAPRRGLEEMIATPTKQRGVFHIRSILRFPGLRRMNPIAA